jgi:hypothetical protein
LTIASPAVRPLRPAAALLKCFICSGVAGVPNDIEENPTSPRLRHYAFHFTSDQLSTTSSKNSAASLPSEFKSARCSPRISALAASTGRGLRYVASLNRTKNVLSVTGRPRPSATPLGSKELFLSCLAGFTLEGWSGVRIDTCGSHPDLSICRPSRRSVRLQRLPFPAGARCPPPLSMR